MSLYLFEDERMRKKKTCETEREKNTSKILCNTRN